MGNGWGLALALGGLLGTGCRKPAPPAPEPPPVRLAIVPEGPTVTAGRVVKFLADITDGPIEGVVWNVLEAEGGAVDNLGRYRAALVPGGYTLEARLVSGRASARTRVTVVAAPNGNIAAPARVRRLATGLRASVTPVPGSTYAWTVRGGRLLAGEATDAVTFEAGEDARVLLACRVTNAAGDSVDSALELPVAPPQTLAIKPAEATVTVGGRMKFGYTLEGGDGGVLWQLPDPGAGALDADGNYRAPGCPGRFQVRVVSREEPGAQAVAQVNVVAAPTGVIAAPASVPAGAAGLSAAVAPQEGMTYQWSVTGGAATGGAASPNLTFRAGPGPKLTLRCLLTNPAGDTLRLACTLPVLPRP